MKEDPATDGIVPALFFSPNQSTELDMITDSPGTAPPAADR